VVPRAAKAAANSPYGKKLLEDVRDFPELLGIVLEEPPGQLLPMGELPIGLSAIGQFVEHGFQQLCAVRAREPLLPGPIETRSMAL
jgi:hypothetical protein